MLNPQTVISIWIIHISSQAYQTFYSLYPVPKYCTKMKSCFRKRNHPENMIYEEMKKVKFSEKGKKSKGYNAVPFVVTYHPFLNYLSRIIKDNLNIL